MLNTRQGKDVYTRIFINCGADINCIDINFAKRNKVNLRKIEKPLKINNVDGSPNDTGAVKYQAMFFFKIGTVIHNETFYAMKCGRDNLILGLPWLNKINPNIDWEKKHIEINDATDQTEAYNRARFANQPAIRTLAEEPTHPDLLPTDYKKEPPFYPDENFHNYVRGVENVYMKGTGRYIKRNGKLVPMMVAKTSISGKLAQKAEQVEVTLSEEYLEFAEVFSEEAFQKMPPRRAYDHPIELDETFKPKVGKVYPLSPDEQKATDDFVEENLRNGKIRPSMSPQASSFFYVGKKDEGIRPCQDYRYVNEHTIKDAYPLPLISDLIDKVKDAKLFTKFDIRSGYNNI